MEGGTLRSLKGVSYINVIDSRCVDEKKKVTSPCGSQLVPHASTKPAQDDLASQFGMRYGRLRLV